MIHTGAAKKPVVVASLQEFFHEALHCAISHQKLAVRDQTEHYVVNLLTLFSRSEALYEETPQGARLKPLVVMLAEALQAPTVAQRQRGLQRLGDVALFMSGFFAGSFARKLIDIDYHIAMGGCAYGSLADAVGQRSPALAGVFAELADKFQGMVDALNEVSEMAHEHTDRDVLRLYEIWMKTGSRRAGKLLRRLGVEPNVSLTTRLQH
jgi:hypothetical protein